MINLAKHIICGFARNIKKINRIPDSTIEPLPKAHQGESVEAKKMKIEKSLEEELDDTFEPLSYDKRLHESIKAKVVQQLKYSYEGEDPNPHKLVHRPSKGAAWGLGGQLMLASKKVQLEGLKPQSNQIIQFLQLHQVKNIYLHDFHAENPERPDNNRCRYHIIGSCYSAKHCWKTGTQLKNAFNLNSGKTKLRRKQEYDPIFAMLNGGKEEEWVLVSYKQYEISLMTQEQREAMDLEWKWNNPVSEEIIDKHMQMKLMRKGRKNQFEDLD